MAIELGNSTKKPGRAQPSMNVTPLVDVVLVLLIIFMVITPLLAKQFWLSLPNKVQKTEPASSDDSRTIVITVDATGSIRMNRELIARPEFSNRLQRALSGTQQRTIFVDADELAQFGDVVSVMDLARAGGASTIAVLTEALPAR
jgi:biopolymer transport protein ExbD/biopolymer transport protein TolR